MSHLDALMRRLFLYVAIAEAVGAVGCWITGRTVLASVLAVSAGLAFAGWLTLRAISKDEAAMRQRYNAPRKH